MSEPSTANGPGGPVGSGTPVGSGGVSRPTGLLRSLTRLQHVLFAALVVIGVFQGFRAGAASLAVVGCGLVLAGWYAVGATREAHRMMSAINAVPERGATARSHAVWWLLVLTAVWVGCVVVAPAFIWVAFALWMLAGHLFRLGPAIAFSLVVLGVVLAAPPLHHEPWTIAGIIGPVVGALFALALSRGQVQLARDALHRAMLVESLQQAQAQSAALHEELLAAQREAGAFAERTRISRDIHDTLAQGFSSILLLARGASAATDQQAQAHLLERIAQTAASGLEDSRRVVAALAPRTLSDTGLTAALQRSLDDLAADTGITVALHVEADLPPMPMNDEITLLRCAQGALANVRQHAHAHRVDVSLFCAGTDIRLDVVDDGSGFDPGEVAAAPRDVSQGGYGLSATRSRLAERGGGLSIESAPGAGTAVSVHLPLRALEANR